MTDLVSRARELLAKITPGPWRADWEDADDWWCITAQPTGGMVCPEVTTVQGTEPDAEFIAAAPDLIAGLLDEVERLQRDGQDTAKQAIAERDRWRDKAWRALGKTKQLAAERDAALAKYARVEALADDWYDSIPMWALREALNPEAVTGNE